VNRQILAEFERRGIGGVVITLPDLEDRTGRDLRAPGEQRLRVRVWTARVENIATLADGERFPGSVEERTNLPEHRFVRDESPVRAGGAHSLIRTQELEDYTLRLSRHPGRRVDAVLEPGETPASTRLTYHVAEQKPWIAYAQVGNYGTEATSDWRERFGFEHNQLTGHDDILRLDYVTGNFSDVHAGFGSYEVPIWKADWLRARAYGSYSEYDASEVGITRIDFSGTQWEAGGRLTANVWQYQLAVRRPVRRRALAQRHREERSRARARRRATPRTISSCRRRESPRASRRCGRGSTSRSAGRPTSGAPRAPGTGSSSPISAAPIPTGTSRCSSGTAASRSFLEPIVFARRGWGDPGSPSHSTLAHEIVISTRGQWAYDDDRLIPQFQQVAGGQFTVRGYDQSIVAGDTAAIGSIEYRYHFARTLDPGAQPIQLPVIGRSSSSRAPCTRAPTGT
jgi:hypothetical protein